MKNKFRWVQFAALLFVIISTASAAFADVEIKTRQTVGGQTSETTNDCGRRGKK